MRKIIKIAITLTLVFGLALTTIPTINATLGPVHVELNMIKPRLSAARANTLTAFKVYMRYNVNIKIHDWLKMWFPIDEAASTTDPQKVVDSICDGLPAITGQKENQRFIPNDAYFKKYNNQEEKDIGKVYAVKDEKGATEFDPCNDCNKDSLPAWSSVCDSSFGKMRMIKDPSGLGCWQLGTIFPGLPRDQTQRMDRMKTIIRSTSIGYSPCSECQGYPIIINNCKERSYQVNTPLEIEAWRKGYNSIDINTSKTTGLIAPATPGRYRVAMATLPEPTPVESEAFMLPCSDISDVNVVLDPPDNDTVTTVSVNFKTGEGGALDGGSSTIMLRLPTSFTLPKKFPLKSIKINGAFVNSSPQVAAGEGYNQITIIVPTDIDNLGQGTITFLEKAGVKNPSASGENFAWVSSSSEPNNIKSAAYIVGVKPTVKVTPNFEKSTAAYYAVGMLPADVKIKAGATFTVNFPDTTMMPEKIDAKQVEINGKAYSGTVGIDKTKLTFTAAAEIAGTLKVKINAQAGIRNPVPGTYKLTFTVDGKEYDFESFEIVKSKPLITELELGDYQGSVVSSYKFKYQPSAGGELSPGDNLYVEFPEGTVVPATINTDAVTICDKPVKEVTVNGMKVTLVTDSSCKPFEWSMVDFKNNAGIKNPRKHGSYTLLVSTDKDEAIKSEEYVLEPAPLKSWIYFKDPDKPNCGEWFNKPPILGFECLNPEAKITFWFNNQPDKAVIYGGESRLNPGSQRAKITWQAEFNGIKEEPQTVDFYLDTVLPPITITEPKTDKVTNKKTFTVEGERGFTEMLTDGDNEKYQVTDSVFVKVDGKEIQLLAGEIYETVNSGSVEFKFKHTVNNLKEGPNVIEFIARDQACNENVVKRTITLDTIAPNIEVVSPAPTDVLAPDDVVIIKVKTESTATVYINGSIANLESTEGDFGIFTLDHTVVDGVNTVEVSASDVAGNTTKKTITFTAKPKQTVIVLTIGKTAWTVNGIEQTPLKTAPATSFAKPHNVLNGNTYMPIAEIAVLLDCKVAWDAKEKKVTLTQIKANGSKKVLELWINKTKGKINGKEVTYNTKGTLYPAIINNKTCLPFRWFAENLDAKVDWNATAKQITLTYQK
ncbi:MAG: hypothetical protein KA140_05610 [Caldisericia bacterium]|nr:hypothetical protein [Caldisericia bacterium]